MSLLVLFTRLFTKDTASVFWSRPFRANAVNAFARSISPLKNKMCKSEQAQSTCATVPDTTQVLSGLQKYSPSLNFPAYLLAQPGIDIGFTEIICHEYTEKIADSIEVGRNQFLCQGRNQYHIENAILTGKHGGGSIMLISAAYFKKILFFYNQTLIDTLPQLRFDHSLVFMMLFV